MKNLRRTVTRPGLIFTAAVAFTFSCLPLAALSQGSNPWRFLPMRVLEIEGGSIAFQSAAIVDTRQRLASPMFQDFPTHYILPVTNDSDFPVWIDIEWRVPSEKPFASSGKVDAKKSGVFFVKIKEVAWDSPIPVAAAVYADQARSRKLGGRDVVLQFRGDEANKKAFLESAAKVNTMSEKMAILSGSKKGWLPLMPGFQEMIGQSKPVAGTAADAELTEDIRLLLWKLQSKSHWDCTHEILGAADLADATNLEKLSDRGKQLVEAGRARGEFAFEEWKIKSCDDISSYLVGTRRSPQGGTDVVATKM